MYHGSDDDDSPRNYSDSEDEGPRHGHHQHSQYPPPSSIRQSSGYGHGPNVGGYGPPHHATSQNYHSQGYGPPPNHSDRYDRGSSRTSSKGKSREHHPSGPPEEERRRPPREPPEYLTYLPGNVPESSTLANANKPGATTFVGDPRPYMHTDPNKPPDIVERAKRSKTKFQWYWPAEQVYGPDGKRLIPFPYIPDIDGPEMPPGYAPIDENGNFLPYGEDVIREVNEIIESGKGSQRSRRKKQQAAERRERNRQAKATSSQPAYQPPPPPPPHQEYRGRDHHHHQEQRSRDRGRARDREAERDSRYPPPGPSQPYRDPGPPSQHSYYQPYNQPPPPPPSNPTPPQQPPPMNQPPRKTPALRILTLLIEDTRKDPGERDQLAEVRVPLKQLEGPEDGFWADANDVCKALQSGPSRVDGPAKVYTLRGKYRQYFLRVNANGEAEYSSANLRVDKDRTLLSVIEAIPMPLEPMDNHHSLSTQSTPRPITPMSLSMGSPHSFSSDSTKRKRSDGSRLASVEMQEQAGSYLSPQSVRAPSPLKDQGRQPAHPSKKPRHNGGLDPDTEMSNARAEPHPWTHPYDQSSGNANPVGSPELVSPLRSPEAGNEMDLDVSSKEREPTVSPHHQQEYLPPLPLPPPPPQVQQRVSPPPQQPQHQRAVSPPKLRPTPTLITGSGSHNWTEDDRNLIEQLKSRMSKDPGYDEFLESRNKQLTMREQLKHYTYIAKQLEEYAHGGSNTKKMHVMGVFGLPESWAATAQETLKLFALYGPGGSEFEDRRVIDMMDEIPPITGKIQASKFLERLRQLHREQNDD